MTSDAVSKWMTIVFVFLVAYIETFEHKFYKLIETYQNIIVSLEQNMLPGSVCN